MRTSGCLALLAVFLLSCPVSARERPEALEGVFVQDQYIPSEFRKAGRVDRIVGAGRVVVLHRASGKAYVASEEDPVHENDAVYTMGAVRCRILLEDRNVVTMAPESDLIIDEVVLDRAKGQKRSLFEITRGKAVFYAIRLFRFRDLQLRVKTPTATVGVRGTKFGTEIEHLPVRGGKPAGRRVASDAPVYLAQESLAEILTRVFVVEGQVNVISEVDGASRDIGENEIIEAGPVGLGQARYDREAVRSFIDSVEGPIVSRRGQDLTPADAGLYEDAEQRQKEDMLRQLDQVEDAKESQIEKEFESKPPAHEPEPSEQMSTPSGGEGYSPHP